MDKTLAPKNPIRRKRKMTKEETSLSVAAIGMLAKLDRSVDFVLEPESRRLKISLLLLGMVVRRYQNTKNVWMGSNKKSA